MVSEDETAGQHHQCNGRELGQTSGDGEGRGGLACCSPRGCKQLDMNGWLKNSNILLLTFFQIWSQGTLSVGPMLLWYIQNIVFFFSMFFITFWQYKMFQICFVYFLLSPRSTGSFYWRMVLDTMIWEITVLILLRSCQPLSADRTRKYMHVPPFFTAALYSIVCMC